MCCFLFQGIRYNKKKGVKRIRYVNTTQENALSEFLRELSQKDTITSDDFAERKISCQKVEDVLKASGLTGKFITYSVANYSNSNIYIYIHDHVQK